MDNNKDFSLDLDTALDMAIKLTDFISQIINAKRDEYEEKLDKAKKVTEEMEEKMNYIQEAADEIDSAVECLDCVRGSLDEYDA